MEHEIANVAAACAMRGFRYMAFPPIVFEPIGAAQPEWDAAEPAVISPTAATVEAAPWPLEPSIAALETMAPPAPPVTEALVPPPRAALPEASPAPPRRFALLSEVSAELRRQETR